MLSLPDVIGILGAIFVLSAYVLLIANIIAADSLFYSLINFLGGVFILFSLFYEWNTAAAFIEIVWIGVSFYGLMQWCRKDSKA